MTNVRTVSDTKRSFYTLHTRPINSIYRRVVEELMVEMHLNSVNVDFSYNAIYALGVVTVFERFMEGYNPQKDTESIFSALIKAIGEDPQVYKQDTQRLQAVAKNLNQELISCLTQQSDSEKDAQLQGLLKAIADNPKFKYSRLFAIGMFSMLESSNPELVKDEKQLAEVLQKITTSLNLSYDKLSKDLELYRSNLDKMQQTLVVMADILSADRKKREERSKAANTPNTDKSDSETSNSDPSNSDPSNSDPSNSTNPDTTVTTPPSSNASE